MIAGRDLRHNPAKLFVFGNLGRHFTRKQIRAGMVTAQDRDCRFVAGGFNGEDRHGVFDPFRALIEGAPLRSCNVMSSRFWVRASVNFLLELTDYFLASLFGEFSSA